MKLFNLMAATSFALILGACGKETEEKLNVDQKGTVLTTLSSINDASLGLVNANKTRKASAPHRVTDVPTENGFAAKVHNPKMEEELSGSECEFKEEGLALDDLFGKTGSLSMDAIMNIEPSSKATQFSINGGQCPVAMTMTSSSSEKDLGTVKDVWKYQQTYKLGVAYKVTADRFKSYNDVTSITFNPITESTTVTLRGQPAYSEIKMSGGGLIHSESQGDIKITLSGGGKMDPKKGLSSDITFRFDYPKFSANLRMTVQTDPKGKNAESHTYLNGEELTPETTKAK